MNEPIKVSSQQDAWEQALLAEQVEHNFEKAFQLYHMARAFDPSKVYITKRLCSLLSSVKKWDQAIPLMEEAVQFAPGDGESWWMLGACYEFTGETHRATDPFIRAVTLSPGDPSAWVNYAHQMLKLGDWIKGFNALSWAFTQGQRKQRHFTPEWEGWNFEDNVKTLWVWCEQGFGDTLMLSRFVPYLLETYKGWIEEIVFEVPYALEPLFSAQCWDNVKIVVSGPENIVPEHDAHIGMLSLPKVLGITTNTLPSFLPLIVPLEMKKRWIKTVSTNDYTDRRYFHLKVGICWHGNPGHTNDRNRSVGLESFEPLLQIDGIDFFGLQYSTKETPEDVKNKYPMITFLEDGLESFFDTAAVISQLDLVITVDTSVAHLGGCLNVPTWILLSKSSDWRWLMDRENSVWYPMVKLYRQEKLGEWGTLMERVRTDLGQMLYRSPKRGGDTRSPI